jgi:hypothetical protein
MTAKAMAMARARAQSLQQKAPTVAAPKEPGTGFVLLGKSVGKWFSSDGLRVFENEADYIAYEKQIFQQGRTPLLSPPKTTPNPGIVWGKGIEAQGIPWEDFLAEQKPNTRLPPRFKVFDFFDRNTGLATSAKTLDTTTPARIAFPGQVYNSLVNSIDEAAGFRQYTLKGVTLRASDIVARELQLAIPDATTPEQWQQIGKAIEYGKSKGVTVKVTIIK